MVKRQQNTPASPPPPAGKPSVERPPSFLWLRKILKRLDPPVPQRMEVDTEIAMRAHLTARFGMLGAIFGIAYVVFYMAIGHTWGALIVLICSSAFAVSPFVLRRVERPEAAGHLLVLTMAFGFLALCGVEGGLRGHAIAWLVSVPLCALLLIGTRAARWWVIILFVAAACIASVDLSGREMPVRFNRAWVPLVSAAGYLGLIAFMYALGLIFESSRARAFGRMQRALKDLAANNEHLVQLNMEKNEFLGIAAHDLKNPLGVILGAAEMINLTRDPRDVHQMADAIVEAGNRMRGLINDLLDANAIEQGKFASKLEPCDLGALVQKSVENNKSVASRKNISLVLGATPGLWVKADKAAVLQILDNLISNALKFSPSMTSVNVHTVPENDHMVVLVRDQGPGLSPEDLKKMFGKFTRLTARPTGGESSTGLGLSIVKKLAEAMSGSVQCQSVLGNGATFSLRLPACPKDQIPFVAMSAPEAEPECIPLASLGPPPPRLRANDGGPGR